jgi:predicted Fe-Mo cluster-binding NifX family protein
MRIAIPDWHGQVSPVFDVAGRLLVVDLDEGREIARKVIVLANLTPTRRVLRLKALGVETLVCGAISRPLEQLVTRLGIRIISLVSGPLEKVERFVALGQPIPETYLLPGCRQPRIRPAAQKQ